MPSSPGSPCNEPGCFERAVYGSHFCFEHRKKIQQRDVQRWALASNRAGTYGPRHRRWRVYVLKADPVCHWPLNAEGDELGWRINGHRLPGRYQRDAKITQRCLAPSTVADHIQPIAQVPKLQYDLRNGQGLCATHHAVKSRLEQMGVIVNTRSGRTT